MMLSVNYSIITLRLKHIISGEEQYFLPFIMLLKKDVIISVLTEMIYLLLKMQDGISHTLVE